MMENVAADVSDHFDSISQDVPDESFLVGGAVRDAVIGCEPNDFDFVVVGESEETMIERGFEPIRATSFPVFHDDEHEEWALARTEQKSGTGYTGFDVFTDDVSLEEDLERRDLTMNAMALSADGTMFDPHDGRRDAEQGILRHVSEAFAEDPVRVLRVARYAARFGFDVADETMDMMRRVTPELNVMSRDRIGMEVVKAMEQARHPSRFFTTLQECGALAVLWSDLDRATVVPAGPDQHHAEGSTFDHSMMVLDRMHDLCESKGIDGTARVRRLLAAVAHDVGKVVSADKQGGLFGDDPPTGFGGHADLGAATMVDVARRLGLHGELEQVMTDACRLHMNVHDVPEMDPNELLSFFDTHMFDSNNGISAAELVDVAHADHEGRLVSDSAGTHQPSFDRDTFDTILDVVESAHNDVDGFEAMRRGLCDEHGADGIEDDALHSVLNDCDDCRSPGEWVGDVLDEQRRSMVEDRLRNA